VTGAPFFFPVPAAMLRESTYLAQHVDRPLQVKHALIDPITGEVGRIRVAGR